MFKYKRYFRLFIFIIIIFIIFNFIIWNLYTKHTSPKEYGIGDLGRLSYQINSLLPRKEIHTLQVSALNFKNTKIDMITIGDSFSDGGGGGKNRFYQSYISSNNNLSVLDIKNIRGDFNYIESILALNNSGFLDEFKPKYILIESVEREVCNRFSREIDYSVKSDLTKKQYNNFRLFEKDENLKIMPDDYLIKVPKKSFLDFNNYNINVLNNLNVNALKYNVFYNFDEKAYSSAVYKFELNKSFFTSADNRSLLAYKNDIKNLYLSTKENITKVNNNLNKLASILQRKNIKLVFMPVVDKYNLYSNYIINNRFHNSNFFELLRQERKNYIFVDTKMILAEELKKNIKNLYYPDDSHWSYKASEAIFKEMKFE